MNHVKRHSDRRLPHIAVVTLFQVSVLLDNVGTFLLLTTGLCNAYWAGASSLSIFAFSDLTTANLYVAGACFRGFQGLQLSGT